MRTLSPVTVLGIDPGYDRVGWCIGQTQGTSLNVVEYGCVETKKSDTLVARYQQIDEELSKVIQNFSPTEAAVEELFFTKNQKTGMHVSEARGVIISTLFRNNVAFFEYTPLEIKMSVTGYGKADKSAVQRMVQMQVGREVLARRKRVVLDDTIDAIAIAMTHAAQRRISTL